MRRREERNFVGWDTAKLENKEVQQKHQREPDNKMKEET